MAALRPSRLPSHVVTVGTNNVITEANPNHKLRMNHFSQKVCSLPSPRVSFTSVHHEFHQIDPFYGHTGAGSDNPLHTVDQRSAKTRRASTGSRRLPEYDSRAEKPERPHRFGERLSALPRRCDSGSDRRRA